MGEFISKWWFLSVLNPLQLCRFNLTHWGIVVFPDSLSHEIWPSKLRVSQHRLILSWLWIATLIIRLRVLLPSIRVLSPLISLVFSRSIVRHLLITWDWWALMVPSLITKLRCFIDTTLDTILMSRCHHSRSASCCLGCSVIRQKLGSSLLCSQSLSSRLHSLLFLASILSNLDSIGEADLFIWGSGHLSNSVHWLAMGSDSFARTSWWTLTLSALLTWSLKPYLIVAWEKVASYLLLWPLILRT